MDLPAEQISCKSTSSHPCPIGNIDHTHPAKNVSEVIEDVLSDEPEETFYLLNEGLLRERVGIFRDNFLPDMPERRIIYAMKANPRKRIMEILAEEGIDGFDCASINEVNTALNHTDGSGVYFNHPIKTRKAIARASIKGVRYFTAQSRNEIEKILESVCPSGDSDRTEIAVRLRTLNEQAMINLSTKYGAEYETACELLKFLQYNSDKAVGGLSINEGSQNTNSATFTKGIQYVTECARNLGGVSSINIGGGIPVNYWERDNFNIKEYLQAINKAIRENIAGVFRKDYGNHKIIIEPGRSIIADPVDLVIPVLADEERDGKKCIYAHDGVFGSFSDYAVHGWQYNFSVIPKDRRSVSHNKKPCVIYGNTCDSGDTLGEVLLPENIQTGDFLWVKSAGAYMDSQSSMFNGFGPFKYVSYNANA